MSNEETPHRRLARLLHERASRQFHPTAEQMQNRVHYGFFDLLVDEQIPPGQVIISENPEHFDQIVMCHPSGIADLKQMLAQTLRDLRKK